MHLRSCCIIYSLLKSACIKLQYKCIESGIVGSKNKKHLMGSTHPTMQPFSTIAVAMVLRALVSIMTLGHIVALILFPLCFLIMTFYFDYPRMIIVFNWNKLILAGNKKGVY